MYDIIKEKTIPRYSFDLLKVVKMLEKTIHSRADKVKSKVLHAAAKLFLAKGYLNSTMREISALAEVNYGSMMFVFKNKESILSELVGFVLDGQFEYTEKMLKGKTDDKILFYATETTLQLYMAESSEHIREMILRNTRHT